MISHFSTIIMCLSGVYCITKFDNLNLSGLVRILKGEIAINEWQAAMDQDIIVNKDADSSKTLNVYDTVYNFWQIADYRAEAEFESIRSIIKMAYRCTLTKYASITAYLIFQELWETKTNTNWAINHTKLKTSNRDDYDKIFKEIYEYTLPRENYILDFAFKLKRGTDQIIEKHDLSTKQKQELHNLWAGFIEKKLRLKIKYKTYIDIMNTRFTYDSNNPFDEVFNEFACVLNEVIQMLDNFILDKCVEHGKSFEKNFESLKTGVQGDFMWLLRNFDEMNARNASKDGQYLNYNQDGNPHLEARDSNWELYRDFSKSIPGALPVHPEIKASGCFVENLEFEISDFKTSLANNIKPTDVYGYNGLDGEIEMKLIETTKPQENTEIKVGMILFSDEDIQ